MTPARNAEADRASLAFHFALTQIGAATVEDALRLWAGVPPTNTASVAGAWLRRAIHLVMTRRGRAREIAMSYYRLVRALRTGTTIANPRKPDPPYVTLGMLRREFAGLIGPSPEGEPTPEDDEDERIYVEELANLDREQERLERAAQQEARIDLEALGTNNLNRKLKDIDPEAPASQVDAAREEAHRQAGNRQAATASRVVMDSARGNIWAMAERDRLVIGYVRLSRTGTPCGWCAMLISRGAVYKSEATAEYADGDKYHDNCNCYAEPVFSRSQFNSSALFELNRRYKELWPQVTRGLSGKAALSAWRRFIRDQEDRAQAARATNNAREA